MILRKWNAQDLESLMHHADNAKIAKNLTDIFPHPYTKESGEWFINFANEHTPTRIFAIDIDGEACGAIGIHPQEDIFKHNAEIGYWLGEAHWGKGIMTQAIRSIVDYGFKTFDIHRIFARPFGSNIASQKALEKNGFNLEAHFIKTIIKNGQLEDELVYAIRKA